MNLRKNTGNPGGRLEPYDSESTHLLQLSLMNNTFFGAIHYDIHLDLKLVEFSKKCHFPNYKHSINYAN